jgi:hypothetical protein
MSRSAILDLAIKAIRCYAMEHYGWAAKYHPEDRHKWDMLMEAAKMLESMKHG